MLASIARWSFRTWSCNWSIWSSFSSLCPDFVLCLDLFIHWCVVSWVDSQFWLEHWWLTSGLCFWEAINKSPKVTRLRKLKITIPLLKKWLIDFEKKITLTEINAKKSYELRGFVISLQIFPQVRLELLKKSPMRISVKIRAEKIL